MKSGNSLSSVLLESSYKEQIKKMHEASTFVIPHKTVELLNGIFAAFVKLALQRQEASLYSASSLDGIPLAV